MHRLLVALLAAFDASVVAVVGIVVVLAPLTVLWVLGMGATDWAALWPATASVWLLGHFVALDVHLPAQYLAAAGIPDAAASFTVSLAPLAFAAFAVWGAARSGLRAGRSGAPWVGAASGTATFTILAAAVWFTGRNAIAGVAPWQAVLSPLLVFGVPVAVCAIWAAWPSDHGVIGRARELIDDLPGAWPDLPALALRGAAIVLTALIGLGSAAVLAALVLRGDQIVALYQAGNFDAIGLVLVSLAQLLYVPTLLVWGLSFVAGPGFSVGVGTAVSPAGTQLGVVPGIPALGTLPESTSPWLLAMVLLPIAAGALAGAALRAGMRDAAAGDLGVRAAAAASTALLSAGGAALLAWAASGAFGPDRLARLGPQPGPVALAVGVEVLIGAAIVLLGPEPRGASAAALSDTVARTASASGEPARDGAPAMHAGDENVTEPLDLGPASFGRAPASAPLSEDDTETAPIDPGLFDDRF